MVKNHARKNDARSRQATTGETFPEAMRSVAVIKEMKLSEYISPYLKKPLVNAGLSERPDAYMAFCPLHDGNLDLHPTLEIDDSTHTWKCYMGGCLSGDDAASFGEAASKKGLKPFSPPILHLGNGVYFDMSGTTPNLNITGASNTGKTLLVRHLLSELKNTGAKAQVVVIAKDVEEQSIMEGIPASSGSLQVSFIGVSRDGDQSDVESLLDSIAAKAKTEGLDEYRHTPLILMVDGINEITDDATISLQVIAKHGASRGIHTVVTSHDGYGPLPIAIRRSGNDVKLGWGNFGRYSYKGKERHFAIGAPQQQSSSFKIGSKELSGERFPNLLVVGGPAAGKTTLLEDVARQALTKGWAVTVLAGYGQEKEWRMEFGQSINLVKDHEAICSALDALTEKRRRMDDAHRNREEVFPELLLMDGVDLMNQSPNQRLTHAAIVNYLRGSAASQHIPVVMSTYEVPWFHTLFSEAAVLGGHNGMQQVRAEEAMKVLSVHGKTLVKRGEGIITRLHERSEPVNFEIHGLLEAVEAKAS